MKNRSSTHLSGLSVSGLLLGTSLCVVAGATAPASAFDFSIGWWTGGGDNAPSDSFDIRSHSSDDLNRARSLLSDAVNEAAAIVANGGNGRLYVSEQNLREVQYIIQRLQRTPAVERIQSLLDNTLQTLRSSASEYERARRVQNNGNEMLRLVDILIQNDCGDHDDGGGGYPNDPSYPSPHNPPYTPPYDPGYPGNPPYTPPYDPGYPPHNPPYNPGYPPPHSSSRCELQSAGSYNYSYYNFRIAIDGRVMDAANNLEDALAKLRSLENAGMCSTIPQEACQLLNAGSYNYSYFNYRVAVGQTVIDASNDMQTALAKINQLVNARVCTRSNGYRSECKLLPAGSYNYSFYNFLIQVNGSTIKGVNSRQEALRAIQDVQYQGLCTQRPQGTCRVEGAGSYNYSYFNYLVKIDGQTIEGSNDLQSAIGVMNEYRSAGVCY